MHSENNIDNNKLEKNVTMNDGIQKNVKKKNNIFLIIFLTFIAIAISIVGAWTLSKNPNNSDSFDVVLFKDYFFMFVYGIIAITIFITRLVSYSKGKSCRWLLERAEKAKKEGRTIIAKFDDDWPRPDNFISYARYLFEVNGKTHRKVMSSFLTTKWPDTYTLYYIKNPARAKTYNQITHRYFRQMWPLISTGLIFAPIIFLSEILGIINWGLIP